MATGRHTGTPRDADGARRVVIFGPNPLLSITIEARDGADDLHVHPAGQGVWVARSASELGAVPVLCGFAGGETGAVLRPLLERMPGERRLVDTVGPSGSYVIDRRSGKRETVAAAWSPAPSRHEVDELFSSTCAEALAGDVLVVCNPLPGDALPLDVYGDLVTDVRASGTPVMVDLSSPRLDSALRGRPDLVKINDWELAEFVRGPVDTEEEMRIAAGRLLEQGAGMAIITRGEKPARAYRGDDWWTIIPPRFERGAREGCGDTMMGALAATSLDRGPIEEALRLGAAAGAVNFLRHGLGTGSRAAIEQVARSVEVLQGS
jgi:1-phosphofructokinase